MVEERGLKSAVRFSGRDIRVGDNNFASHSCDVETSLMVQWTQK